MLNFTKLSVSLKETGATIVKSASLETAAGSVHAILGPNGSGKSTLAGALVGHPALEQTAGEIFLDQVRLNELEPEERARAGLFLSFQHPLPLPGVKITTFLRTAVNTVREARGEAPLSTTEFITRLRDSLTQVGLSPTFANRVVNEGFSGGERKRLELVQALLLDPKVVILDEIDSGLDIDAIKTVANIVNQLREQGKTILLITHYQRLLDYVKPDHVHIFAQGAFIRHGGSELVAELEKSGYNAFINVPAED